VRTVHPPVDRDFDRNREFAVRGIETLRFAAVRPAKPLASDRRLPSDSGEV
jgi:hypothetical protein